MFCQEEEIDDVLGNHKGARDHLESRFLFTLSELQIDKLLKIASQPKAELRNYFQIFYNT